MISLALHYLAARKKQTLLMLLGIFFGTASFTTLSGLLLGFKDYLVNQLVNNSAALHVEPARDGGFIAHPGAWYRRLDADPGVAAYSPQLVSPAILSLDGRTASGRLVGCDPGRQARVTTIGDYVVKGSWAGLAGGTGRLALGAELRRTLGAELGQKVVASSGAGAPRAFTVVAVFQTGVRQGDTQAYVPLADARRLDRAGGKVNDIAVRLKDYTRAGKTAGAWSRLGPERVESWDELNPSIVNMFKAEDLVRFLAVGAVMLVAAFGIYNVLSMTVVQKRMDIAILRSMGYSFGDVLALFLWQGLVLGACGAALGCLAGWGLGLYLRTVSFGGNPFGAGTGRLAVSLSPSIFIQAALLALLATCLATLLPAWAAGKLNPIEIIRAGAE